jgi:hypothetical protein
MIEIITACSGEKYRNQAAEMSKSFIRHGWPKLTIITDLKIEGCESNQIIQQSKMTGCRDLKTLFATFSGFESTSIWWIDCDCIATGPPIDLRIPDGHIAGRVITRLPAWAGGLPHLAGTVAGVGGRDHAIKLSKTWHDRHAMRPKGSSDEMGLFEAAASFPVIDIKGDYYSPLPNLTHLGATSGERNRNPPKIKWISHS